MPALTDIGKYKRLAELFVLCMKVDPQVSVARNNAALTCMMDHGLTERQAEKFLNNAFTLLERNMVRPAPQTVADVAMFFRTREHEMILSHVQVILEAGDITDEHQALFDLCTEHLYRG